MLGMPNRSVLTIAREPWLIRYQGVPSAGQLVEQCRLADVGAPDDRYYGENSRAIRGRSTLTCRRGQRGEYPAAAKYVHRIIGDDGPDEHTLTVNLHTA